VSSYDLCYLPGDFRFSTLFPILGKVMVNVRGVWKFAYIVASIIALNSCNVSETDSIRHL
jgi:hypothetical protein